MEVGFGFRLRGALCSLVLLPLIVASAGSGASADETGIDDAIGGFEDEDGMEDVFGGFDDEEEDFGTTSDEPDEPSPWDIFDLTGNVSHALTYNYLDHRSEATPLRTEWNGLSRFRTRLNLQLDVDLPAHWKARAAGFISYDAAYRIDDRPKFTHQVLHEYETDWDAMEVWLQGSLSDSLDVKIGRQILNWGRSDTLRVVDVVNPLDNREPGLADIEDLRRPVGMLRLDYYWGDWGVTAVVIPELRFDRDPAFGSDFNPSPVAIPNSDPAHWGSTPEFGGAINGIFEGWDISFYGGHFMDNRPALEFNGFLVLPGPMGPIFIPDLEFRHSRFWMIGAGGNYTFGSFLLKAEIAFFDDRKVQVTGGFASLGAQEDQLNAMGGIEYYGISDTSIALEIANNRILNRDPSLKGIVEKNVIQTAIRYTADFMNSRLHATALAVLFGEKAQDGSIVRLEASYDLRDALVIGGGILLFQSGDSPLFANIGRNDRLFMQIKHSF